MIIALMRYKITGKYSIDSVKLGPTEARVIISAIFSGRSAPSQFNTLFCTFCEHYSVFVNVIDTRKLLYIADSMDMKEVRKKTNGEDA